mgnify:CR=1 FL=1
MVHDADLAIIGPLVIRVQEPHPAQDLEWHFSASVWLLRARFSFR